jgi:hypothetical protein
MKKQFFILKGDSRHFKKVYHCASLYLYANWLTPGESNLLSIVGPYEVTPPLVFYFFLSLFCDAPSSASSDSSQGSVLSPFRTFVFQMKWNVNLTAQTREPSNSMICWMLHPAFITRTYMLLTVVTILTLTNLRQRATLIPCSVLHFRGRNLSPSSENCVFPDNGGTGCLQKVRLPFGIDAERLR